MLDDHFLERFIFRERVHRMVRQSGAFSMFAD
jgi:hypothetical protein